jgi:hypothetical protein
MPTKAKSADDGILAGRVERDSIGIGSLPRTRAVEARGLILPPRGIVDMDQNEPHVPGDLIAARLAREGYTPFQHPRAPHHGWLEVPGSDLECSPTHVKLPGPHRCLSTQPGLRQWGDRLVLHHPDHPMDEITFERVRCPAYQAPRGRPAGPAQQRCCVAHHALVPAAR